MRRSVATAIIIGLGLAACKPMANANGADAASTAPASAISESEAQKIVGAAIASYTSGDPQKVMANYAPGAVLFDSGHPDPSTDRAMQTRWAADFVLMKPTDFIAHPVIQPLSADAFIASGVASFTADVAGHRDVLHTRYSQVFQKQPDGRWLIIHEHMSTPPAATPAP